MRDRVLVVGGAGYIGGAAVDLLVQRECDILVYDILMYERDYRKHVPFVYGDILEKDRLQSVFEEFHPTAVIWLAAIVGDGACQVNPDATMQINQLAVKWLSERYDGRIVFTSTCSVYGKAEGILTETSPANPLSTYAATKLAAEAYLRDHNAVVFRLGTLHGVSDQFSRIRLDLVANILSLKAMRGRPLTVFGGEQWRPILHVRDAARAIVNAAMIHDIPNNVPPGVYNIAQQNITIRELAEIVKDVAPVESTPQVTISDMGFEDARNYRVDVSKYAVQPGAVPFNISLRESVLELMELLRQGRIKDPFSSVFHNARFLEDFTFSVERL